MNGNYLVNFANLILIEVGKKKAEIASAILSGQCSLEGYRYNAGVHNTLEDLTPLVKDCLKKILKQEGFIEDEDAEQRSVQ